MSSNMIDALIAGDTLDFVDVVAEYPATDGWTLKYRLVPRTVGQTAQVLQAFAEGQNYRVQAAPAVTAAWSPGNYMWARWVEKTGARQSLGDGQLVVKPDPSFLAAGYDGRSQARKAIDDLRAAFATYNSSNGAVRRYKILDREMEFTDSAQIIQRIEWWEGELAREEAAADRQAGRRPKNRILTRFTRPS